MGAYERPDDQQPIVTPIDAQYWDAPGATVMAAVALSGTRLSMRENGKVTMR